MPQCYATDEIRIAGVPFYLVTQECAGGWETFLANDAEGTTRFNTFESRSPDLGTAADLHRLTKSGYVGLTEVAYPNKLLSPIVVQAVRFAGKAPKAVYRDSQDAARP